MSSYEGIFAQSQETINVLHVDDKPSQTDLTATLLEKESDSMAVQTENSPVDALDRIASEEVDCVVSDYDMPEMNGLEFLENLRTEHPELPFILFTGKGSEEIASEAISRGVTDYLQKGMGSDRYTVLANRIENAVAQYRAEREVEQRSEWYQRILEHSSDYVLVVDGMGKVKYASPSIKRVTGYTQEDVTGINAFDTVHPEDLEYASEALSETITNAEKEVTVEFRAITKSDEVIWLEARGSNFLDDPIINGVMVNVRDITKRKEREQALERQKKHLKELNEFLSHDVNNQLSIITAHAELANAENESGSDSLEKIAAAADRIDEMIEKANQLAETEEQLSTIEPVELERVVDRCWRGIVDGGNEAELVVESTIEFEADEERFRSLLENLLMNAVDHGGPSVRIRVGRLDDADGFYVEDDGPGIPEEDRERVLETDYSTSEDGTGLGLKIVRYVADAHDWEVNITESASGGARFEIAGVKEWSDE